MGNAVAQVRSISQDTASIIAWKAAEGPRKELLLAQIFRAKSGLIRQLTAKTARAEKTSEDMEDLFQAGCIGFHTALKKFDPDRGWAISTYAAWWIRHEVQRVARHGPVVSLPRIRLTNEERGRAVLALRADPDVSPESLGIRRSQLEQVRNSIGVKFLSDSVERGARLLERKLIDGQGLFDAEGDVDEARRYRALTSVIARVRSGESSESLGLPPDAYAAALEIIRAEDAEREIIMNEAVATEVTTQIRKRPGPKPGAARKRAPVVAAKKPLHLGNARAKLAAMIAEHEAAAKRLSTLLAFPEAELTSLLATLAA